MTSQPSRSRASTKMSRPNMAGPTSARRTGDFAGFAFADSVVLLMGLLGCGGAAKGNKKPTAVASRGFLLNFYVQQTPTAPPTTTTASMTACDTFFNIAEIIYRQIPCPVKSQIKPSCPCTRPVPRGLIWILAGQNPGNRLLEFGQGKRLLEDMIHTPGRFAISDEVFRIGRGQDDALRGPALFDEGHQFVPLHVRHEIIRDDQVELGRLQQCQRRFPALGGLNFVAEM